MIFTKNDVKKYDLSNMRDSILSFPNQLNNMIKKIDSFQLNNKFDQIDNILILGMGGSAIGAEICQVLIKDKCKIPIIINRNYVIPNWVNKKTLVIASSYSGNTEETIEAYLNTLKLTVNIIVISTGGKLSKLAKNNNNDLFVIDKNYQPRAAIGYSIMAILFSLIKTKNIDFSIVDDINEVIEDLKKYSNDLSKINKNNYAIEMAYNLESKNPIIYGSIENTDVIALRFRGQLQENAKMMAFHNVMPEMNHNEIEASNYNNNSCILWLLDKRDHIQIQKRIKISKKILEEEGIKNHIIEMKGSKFIERFFKFIILTDWISFYLAIINKIDPSPVEKITKLKILLKSNEIS